MGTERKYTLTYEGKTMSLYEWAQALSFSYRTIYSRYKAGKFTPGQILGLEPLPKRKAPNKGEKGRHYTRIAKKEVAINGETKTLIQWARDVGLDYGIVKGRLRRGWSYEQALGLELSPKEIKRSEMQRRKIEEAYKGQGEITDKGLTILCGAIAVQAANDYRHALRRLQIKPDDVTAQGAVIEVEQFFRSAYFQHMLDIDPEFLIENLRKEVENGKKVPNFSRKTKGFLGAANDKPGKAVRNGTIIYKNISQ